MTHKDELSLKIPAYLRGELLPEEVAEVEALAAKDMDFAADIEFQRAIGGMMKAEQNEESGLEFGWARLSKAIDAESKSEALIPANDRAPSRFWQYAAAALALVVVGQTVYLGSKSVSDDKDVYRMAGQSESGISIDMQPKSAVTTQELTEFLISYDAVITGGPDEEGAYRVVFADIESCKSVTKTLGQDNPLFEAFTECEAN